MSHPDIFFNGAGRVRSGWRLAVFAVAFLVMRNALFLTTYFGLAFVLPRATLGRLAESDWGYVLQFFIYFVPAALAGWACARVIEELPWRSLGWALHPGWRRDVLAGLAIGAASVCVAAGLGAAVSSYRFQLAAQFDPAAFARTLLSSAFVFLLGAAAEEMIFRGYPLQTMMRSWPVLLALLPVSVPFALAHLDNPHVSPVFTIVNTTLAGAWLSVAYWRTRSLWFPLGVHFGWNWFQGAIIGSPVSGITQITPTPLFRLVDSGQSWVGGGSYGIEGGLICTLALLISTLFIWRTRLVSASDEMRRYTDGENPNHAVKLFDLTEGMGE